MLLASSFHFFDPHKHIRCSAFLLCRSGISFFFISFSRYVALIIEEATLDNSFDSLRSAVSSESSTSESQLGTYHSPLNTLLMPLKGRSNLLESRNQRKRVNPKRMKASLNHHLMCPPLQALFSLAMPSLSSFPRWQFRWWCG